MEDADAAKLKKGFEQAKKQPMYFAALVHGKSGALVIAKQPVGASALAAAKKTLPGASVVAGGLRWDENDKDFKFVCSGGGGFKQSLEVILKAALGKAPKFAVVKPAEASQDESDADDAPGVDEALRKHVSAAKSAKRFFALVGDAPVKGKLLLASKAVAAQPIALAKETYKAAQCLRGVVEVIEGTYVFKFAKQPPSKYAAVIKALIRRDTGLSLKVSLGVVGSPDELGTEGGGDELSVSDSSVTKEDWAALAEPLRIEFRTAFASGTKGLDEARKIYEESKQLANTGKIQEAIDRLRDFEAALDAVAPPAEMDESEWKTRALKLKKSLQRLGKSYPDHPSLQASFAEALALGRAKDYAASHRILDELTAGIATSVSGGSSSSPPAPPDNRVEPHPPVGNTDEHSDEESDEDARQKAEEELDEIATETAVQTSAQGSGQAPGGGPGGDPNDSDDDSDDDWDDDLSDDDEEESTEEALIERVRSRLAQIAEALKTSPALRIEGERPKVSAPYELGRTAFAQAEYVEAQNQARSAFDAIEAANLQQEAAKQAWEEMEATIKQAEAHIAFLEDQDDFDSAKLRYDFRHALREGGREDFVAAKQRLEAIATAARRAVEDQDSRKEWNARAGEYQQVTMDVQDVVAQSLRFQRLKHPLAPPLEGVGPLESLKKQLVEAKNSGDLTLAGELLTALGKAVAPLAKLGIERGGKLDAIEADRMLSGDYESIVNKALEGPEKTAVLGGDRLGALTVDGLRTPLVIDHRRLLALRADYSTSVQDVFALWEELQAGAVKVIQARYAYLRRNQPTEAAKLFYEARWIEEEPGFVRPALETVDFTEAIREGKQELVRQIEAMIESATELDFLTALRQLDEAKAIAERIFKLAESPPREAKLAAKAWNATAGKRRLVERAALPSGDQELASLKQQYEMKRDEFRMSWEVEDWDDCLGEALTLFRGALDAIWTPLAKGFQEKIDAIESGDAAKDFINSAKDDLPGLSPEMQIELLKKLRKGDMRGEGMSGAQIEVYRAMKLDEAFLKDDKGKRKKCVEDLLKLPELREAQDKWDEPNQMSDEDKLKLLIQVAAVECKAYGFEGPPKIKLQKFSTAFEGYYSPEVKTIFINTHPDAGFHKDFKETIDTILHENVHHLQDQLVSGVVELGPDDPRQTQVELFRINAGENAYCDPNEDQDVYEQQPMEAHAFMTGRKSMAGITAGLGGA